MTSTLETPVSTDHDARPVTLQAAGQTKTALWNDSADPSEPRTAIE